MMKVGMGAANNLFLDFLARAHARHKNDQRIRKSTKQGDHKAPNHTGMQNLKKKIAPICDCLGRCSGRNHESCLQCTGEWGENRQTKS